MTRVNKSSRKQTDPKVLSGGEGESQRPWTGGSPRPIERSVSKDRRRTAVEGTPRTMEPNREYFNLKDIRQSHN
jgi:hypothetical protein